MENKFVGTIKIKNTDEWQNHIREILKKHNITPGTQDNPIEVDDNILEEIMTFDFEYETILL